MTINLSKSSARRLADDKQRLADAEKLDKMACFMLQYVSVEWYWRQKRMAEDEYEWGDRRNDDKKFQ